MKTRKISTTVLFLIVSLGIYTQPYKSILANNTAKWTIMVVPDWARTQTWYSTGQTTINNVQYTLIRSGDPFWFSYFRFRDTYIKEDADSLWKNRVMLESELIYERHLRESGDYSKLYLYDINAKTEYLIMDLNLSKGDMFYLPKSSQYYFDNVNEKKVVDSVYIKDGLKHIQLNAVPNSYGPQMPKLTFVEGVGPNLGVFYIYGGEIVNPDFFCLQCFQNKDRFYGNSPCVFDDNYTGLDDVISKFSYSLEQAQNSITIKSKNKENGIIYLYNSIGQRVYQKLFADTDMINLNTENFHKGIYVILVTNFSDVKRFSKKIILK